MFDIFWTKIVFLGSKAHRVSMCKSDQNRWFQNYFWGLDSQENNLHHQMGIRKIIVSYRESIASYGHKFAKKCEVAKKCPELRQNVKIGKIKQIWSNLSKIPSTLAEVTKFAKNGPKLLQSGKIGQKWTFCKTAPFAAKIPSKFDTEKSSFRTEKSSFLIPKMHRFVPKNQRFVPKNHRFVPRKLRFVPRQICQKMRIGKKRSRIASNCQNREKKIKFCQNSFYIGRSYQICQKWSEIASKLQNRAKNQLFAKLLHLQPKSPQNLIPKNHRFVPRNHRFVPKMHRFVPKNHRFVPKNHRFVPRNHPFCTENASFRTEKSSFRTEKSSFCTEIIVSYRESIVSCQEMRAETNLLKNANWQKKVQNCVKLSKSGKKKQILPKFLLHWQKLPNLPKMVRNCFKVAKSAKNQLFAKLLHLQPKSPQNLIPKSHRFVPRKHRFVPKMHRFVPKNHRFVPKNHRFVPKNHRFAPRKHRFVRTQICEKMRSGKKMSRIASKCQNRENKTNLIKFVQNSFYIGRSYQICQKLSEIASKWQNRPKINFLQNCSICSQNPLKIWYRKIIVSYRKCIVSYRKIIVSYREIIVSYRKIIVSYRESIVSNRHKLAKKCEFAKKGPELRQIVKIGKKNPNFAKIPSKNGPKLLQSGKIGQKCTFCKTAPFAAKIPSKFDTEKSSFRTEKSSFRTENASFRTEKASFRTETNLPKNANLQKNVQNCVTLSKSGKKTNFAKIPSTLAEVTKFAKNGPKLLQSGKIGQKWTFCKTAPFAAKIPSKFDTEKSSFRTEKSSFCTENASFRTEKSSFRTEKSSFRTEKSSFCTENASLLRTEKASFCTENASLRTKKSSFRTEKASFRTETNLPKNANWQKKVQKNGS